MDERLFQVRLYREDLSFSAGHISTYADGMEGHHGHNYQLSVTFEGPLNSDGLVIDFRTVKSTLRSIIGRLNHRTLVPRLHPRLKIHVDDRATRIEFGSERMELPTSNVVLLEVSNVTSELLAGYVLSEIIGALPEEDCSRLASVTVEVIESPGQSASVSARL